MRIKLVLLSLICVLGLVFTTAAQAVVLDDFSSGDLSAYTKNVILDQDAAFEVSFTSTGGALQVTKSADTHAEQVLFMLPYSMQIGDTLRVDKNAVKVGVYADFGIAVAGSTTDPGNITYNATPNATVDGRKDYVAIYMKGQYANLGTIGWTGTPSQEYSSSGIWTGQTDAQLQALFATVTGLYITRTGTTAWDAGYTTATGDVIGHSYTNIPAGGAVGFFADVRAVTTYGDLDNLRIVPEPATAVLALIGFLGMGLLWLRKRS